MTFGVPFSARSHKMEYMKPRAILTAALVIILVAACATTPTGRRQLIIVSEDSAIAASKQAYVQQLKPYEKKGKLNNDPETVTRVRRITSRLIPQAIKIRPETNAWDWSINVIDDPETVNAWAMAGGKMAIYTGLIDKLGATDDEIAQVMGHEIAHALAKHTAEKMSVAMASQVGIIAIGIAADHQGAAMAAATAAAALAITLPNSRTAEAEADRIGIELAAKAGYDPQAAVMLWEKMAKVSGEGPPQFLSTHPAPSNRRETLQRLVPQMRPYYEQSKVSPLPTYDLR